MTDYRIEAATKEEWAERALRAEAALEVASFYQEKDIDALQNRIAELEAKLADREKAYSSLVDVANLDYWKVKAAEAKLAELERQLDVARGVIAMQSRRMTDD